MSPVSDGGPRFDRTITPSLLEELVDEQQLIAGFNPDNATGASYDFRAGEKVVVARPEAERHKFENLKDQEQINIEPGNAYTIYSMEEVHLPNDVQGRLSLKFRLAAKKLFYSGGLIDPGYEGHLFFTIFNLSSSDYTIEYGDSIAAGEFKFITESKKPYDRGRMDTLPEGMLPKRPDFDHKTRNMEQINSLLSEHDSTIDELSETTRTLDRNISEMESRLLDRMNNIESRHTTLLVGGLASVLAGITGGITVRILMYLV